MEQISIIERFPYPFQVSPHCTPFASPLCLAAGCWGTTPEEPGAKHDITAPVPAVTQPFWEALLLSTVWGAGR